ncbi:MAG: hypothetical protein ACP5EN_14165 [Rhodovulum sp.]
MATYKRPPESRQGEKKTVALAEEAAERKSSAQRDIGILLQIRLLELLQRKGIVSSQDLEVFVSDFESNIQPLSRSSPERGYAAADAAELLREVLLRSENDPN